MNLTFRFDSLQAFLWMDGHGPYVWSCYAVVFLTLLFLVWEPKVRRSRLVKQQKSLAFRRAQNHSNEE